MHPHMPEHYVRLPPITAPLAAAFAVLYLLYMLWQNGLSKKGLLSLPPGPAGIPLLGNIPDIVRESKKGQQHLLIQQWARKYGDVFKVQIGRHTEYYLNSDRAVKELLDRSSAQTSQRPRWIHQRRVIHSGVTSVAQADAGLPFLHYETAKFVHQIANNPSWGQSPAKIWSSLGRYTYSTFASQIFGMEIPKSDDPVIAYIHETGLAQIKGTLPGMYIVDTITLLDRLPLYLKPWESDARARFQRDWDWCMEKLERVKRQESREDSNFRPSFLRMVVDDEKHLGFQTVEEAAYLSLMVLLGAADTSQMSTWSFMEAMIMFPDVKKKAQSEIDRVVNDRLPVFSDIEQIPYVRCLMKELWRWRPPVALGHPHITTRDLEYRGYRIPKGASLHLNAWAIGHDPARHEDPERFWPERYMHDKTTTMQSINSSDVSTRDHFAFGAGRRICLGYNVAERSLAVSIMRLLWSFDITPIPGTPLPLDPSSYPSMIPGNPGVDLPVTLTVRSAEKKAIIDRDYEEQCKMRPQMESLG
ncbi:cytochrome P450 [Dactylonectria macrodidyma]|uniref:Cytochrome P450 n=1 Tax=Dactylonectria macrodidyma TaxID=307937 RepID=A0A9P9IL10_9HYPO|nr:cytochrome P450 [Dactylonectria macrodidyma]